MNAGDHRAQESRAKSRKEWPIAVFRLGEEAGEDLSAFTTPAQRIEMMWPLALEAWGLAGLALPSYSRAETPIRVLAAARGKRGGGSS